jgi:membrane fusion protein, multidrug efflux system
VPNPDGLLTAGGVVGVTVERGAPRLALTVPQAAVLLDQAGRYVLVVDAEKKVEQRRVTLGVEQGRNVVVTDGLKGRFAKPTERVCFGPKAALPTPTLA